MVKFSILITLVTCIAAILEYDSGLHRIEAEKVAYQMALVEFVMKYYPEVKAEFNSILNNQNEKHK